MKQLDARFHGVTATHFKNPVQESSMCPLSARGLTLLFSLPLFFTYPVHPTSFDNPVSALAELASLYWVVLSSHFNRQSPTAAV